MPWADLHVGCRSAASLRSLEDLGYSVVCWSSEATGAVPPKPPALVPSPALPASSSSSSSFTRPLQQCTRLTLSLEEESHAFALTGAREALRAYDVVAVAPATEPILERVLQSPACEAIDIICFPAGQRPPFNLRPAMARRLLGAGLHVELCYSAALRDSSARRHFICNLQAMLEALPKGGKRKISGLIISSGADEPRLLRSPRDILALVGAFGCKYELAKLALKDNPFRVLERAARRQTVSPGAPSAVANLHAIGPVPSAAAATARLGGKRLSNTASSPGLLSSASGKTKRMRT